MPNAWLIRSSFTARNYMQTFYHDHIISIDYEKVTALNGKSREEMKQLLQTEYPALTERQINLHVNTLQRMADEAREGDYIVVTDEDNVYFGTITSDYIYDPSRSGEGLPHVRHVAWLQGPVRRSAIPSELRAALQAPISFSDLSHLTGVIITYLDNTPPQRIPILTESNLRTFTYPVRLDVDAIVQIPGDITQQEAARLADFVRTLYFA